MVKITRAASVAALAGLALGISTLAAPPARAVSTSDQAAAILYWPKIVWDGSVDTLIRLSNTDTRSLDTKQAHCYYIDANSHCSNNPTQICHNRPFECGAGTCVPGWMEIDFDVMLTYEQPLAWRASQGLSRYNTPLPGGRGVCAEYLPYGQIVPCFTSSPGCTCTGQPSNAGTGVPPVPETPFIGSLMCIQYAPAFGSTPARPDNSASTRNSLIGQATLQKVATGMDVATYNAPGLRFKGVEANVPINELRLDNVQYDSCPTALVLDHVFDNAPPTPGGGGSGNRTELTLIPCGNNFAAQIPGNVTAQFLVFNEFEQRYSTTRAVPCLLDSPLSLIDTTNPARSIFNAQVMGTPAGQTRIKGVGTAATGRGLLGAALLISPLGTAAYVPHQNGSPVFGAGVQPDVITLP